MAEKVGKGRKVGEGLAKGWRGVGEGLAKGWRSSLHPPVSEFPRRPFRDMGLRLHGTYGSRCVQQLRKACKCQIRFILLCCHPSVEVIQMSALQHELRSPNRKIANVTISTCRQMAGFDIADWNLELPVEMLKISWGNRSQ